MKSIQLLNAGTLETGFRGVRLSDYELCTNKDWQQLPRRDHFDHVVLDSTLLAHRDLKSLAIRLQLTLQGFRNDPR